MLFEDLPTEIIEAILSHLPPKSLVTTSKTSKKLHQVANTPLLWRAHCRTQFRFWDPSHGLPSNFTSPLNDISWKTKFKDRMNLERRVDQSMDILVNSQTDRLPTMQRMLAMSDDFAEYTYDVKEALLRHCAAPEEREDHLARRYWATAVLEKLHRGLAIEEWKRCMLRGGTSSEQLERNLAAFDLFVSDDEHDINSVISSLDDIASELQAEHPELETLPTREKAITVATFLRARGHNGASDEEYHNLPNNFLGKTLRDPEHHSLPLIAVSIFCFVARRIGLSAHPCSFPMHVYAIVSSPDDQDLDGRPSSKAPQNMYIDAFRDPIEVPQHHLLAQLRSMGAAANPDEFLSKAADTEIIVRSSRNIMHSVQTLQMHGNIPLPAPDDPRTPLWYRQKPDFDKAFYASLVNEKSTRYVAQQNITPVNDEPSEALRQLAGRYFKRWDRVTKRFVSNIKDEYPDD
ncbi:hypothetical protein EG327_005063 [Venturia inaequalis]|uniref:F-box domain-containing protein n=1 Tax=Venturia inaequalis TaxID=5025 RepID=A0A8H3V6X7_VENIN|nr:hypothetical protein EG327_005063 [Venturia inaequalis]